MSGGDNKMTNAYHQPASSDNPIMRGKEGVLSGGQ